MGVKPPTFETGMFLALPMVEWRLSRLFTGENRMELEKLLGSSHLGLRLTKAIRASRVKFGVQGVDAVPFCIVL
jgi:hypothetical protein